MPGLYLTPTDEDRLQVFVAAELARRLLQRGLRLNAPEAVALVCDTMHLAARGGASLAAVADLGLGAVDPTQLIDGVAGLVDEIRLEVLCDEGARLVVLRQPFGPAGADAPGAVRAGAGAIELAAGLERRRLSVRNDSLRPVRVSSHYPLWRTNRRLAFDRDAALGFRLDLPSGESIRWAPGETREVSLVRLAGDDRGSGADLGGPTTGRSA